MCWMPSQRSSYSKDRDGSGKFARVGPPHYPQESRFRQSAKVTSTSASNNVACERRSDTPKQKGRKRAELALHSRGDRCTIPTCDGANSLRFPDFQRNHHLPDTRPKCPSTSCSTWYGRAIGDERQHHVMGGRLQLSRTDNDRLAPPVLPARLRPREQVEGVGQSAHHLTHPVVSRYVRPAGEPSPPVVQSVHPCIAEQPAGGLPTEHGPHVESGGERAEVEGGIAGLGKHPPPGRVQPQEGVRVDVRSRAAVLARVQQVDAHPCALLPPNDPAQQRRGPQ